MTNQTYILIIAPPSELAARVNERWADYALWQAPFVVGGNICQAMVRREDDDTAMVRREDDDTAVAMSDYSYAQMYGNKLPVVWWRASSVVYNVESEK